MKELLAAQEQLHANTVSSLLTAMKPLLAVNSTTAAGRQQADDDDDDVELPATATASAAQPPQPQPTVADTQPSRGEQPHSQ